MAADTHYFYVLLCKDNTFYGGYTTDLIRRLHQHNQGVGAKYTHPASRRPLQMIHAESFATRSEATKAEAAFKKLVRKHKERYLTEQKEKNVLNTQSSKESKDITKG